MKADSPTDTPVEYEIKKDGDNKWNPLSERDAMENIRQSGDPAILKKRLDMGEEISILPDKKIRRKRNQQKPT